MLMSQLTRLSGDSERRLENEPGMAGLLQQGLSSLDVLSALLQDGLHISQLPHFQSDLFGEVLELSRCGWHLQS